MKKLIHTLAALTLLSILAACGGEALPTATEAAAPTQSVPTPTEAPTEAAAAVTEAPVTSEAAPTEDASTVSFAADVYPILEAKCIKCHGVEQVKEGLTLLTYTDLMAGSFNGPVVIAGNADESPFVNLVARGKMPNRGPKATEAELQTLRDWVNQGALNN